MDYIYALQVFSTGETIRTRNSHHSQLRWKGYITKKLLRGKVLAARFRTAIEQDDLAIAWINYDEMKAIFSEKEMQHHRRLVWRGVDK